MNNLTSRQLRSFPFWSLAKFGNATLKNASCGVFLSCWIVSSRAADEFPMEVLSTRAPTGRATQPREAPPRSKRETIDRFSRSGQFVSGRNTRNNIMSFGQLADRCDQTARIRDHLKQPVQFIRSEDFQPMSDSGYWQFFHADGSLRLDCVIDELMDSELDERRSSHLDRVDERMNRLQHAWNACHNYLQVSKPPKWEDVVRLRKSIRTLSDCLGGIGISTSSPARTYLDRLFRFAKDLADPHRAARLANFLCCPDFQGGTLADLVEFMRYYKVGIRPGTDAHDQLASLHADVISQTLVRERILSLDNEEMFDSDDRRPEGSPYARRAGSRTR